MVNSASHASVMMAHGVHGGETQERMTVNLTMSSETKWPKVVAQFGILAWQVYPHQ